MQNAQSTVLLPTTSVIALTVGYKMSDKATTGIGASYILGLGKGINHIRLSNQGAGLRSFVDFKAKGSIWITGGLEYNYYEAFAKLSQLEDIIAWQKSALVGITKKYKIGKKNGNMQLLYDFLSNRKITSGKALKFRIGWSF